MKHISGFRKDQQRRNALHTTHSNYLGFLYLCKYLLYQK